MMKDEPKETGFQILKAEMGRQLMLNRPNEYAALEKHGEAAMNQEPSNRAKPVWEQLTRLLDQGAQYHEAMHALAYEIAPPLEADHPLNLMERCNSFEEWDELMERRSCGTAGPGG